MIRRLEHNLAEITGFIILALVFYYVVVSDRWTMSTVIVPESLLAFNTIFLSILIEALPFVLVGVFIAGIIQVFVTEEHIKKTHT